MAFLTSLTMEEMGLLKEFFGIHDAEVLGVNPRRLRVTLRTVDSANVKEFFHVTLDADDAPEENLRKLAALHEMS